MLNVKLLFTFKVPIHINANITEPFNWGRTLWQGTLFYIKVKHKYSKQYT